MFPLRRLPYVAGVGLFALAFFGCEDKGDDARSVPSKPDCEDGDECSTCSCSTRTHQCYDGTCQPLGKTGDTCESPQQCHSKFCFEDACRDVPAVGEPCDACSNCMCLGVGPVGVCSKACKSTYYPKTAERPNGLHADDCNVDGQICQEGLCRPECSRDNPCPGYARNCSTVYSVWLTGTPIGGACRSTGPNDQLIPDDKTNCPITRDGLDPSEVAVNEPAPDAGRDAGRDASTDASIDAGRDASIDGGRDASVDAGRDASTDAGAPRRWTFVRADTREGCGIRNSGIDCWSGGFQLSPLFGQKATWYRTHVHSCALRGDQTIMCVTARDYATPPLVTQVPSGQWTQISTQEKFGCALNASGTLRCWGTNVEGSTTAPSGSFKMVATTIDSGCAIDVNGAIVCWGARAGTMPPPGRFIHIEGDENSFCAVDEDGAAHCWGVDPVHKILVPPSDVKFKSIAVDHTAACGPKQGGGVACFGTPSTSVQKPPTSGDFSMVSLQWDTHACAVRADGVILCWSRSLTSDTYDQALWTPLPP